jgi:hypothetical protein
MEEKHLRVRRWMTIADFPNFEISNDGQARNTKTGNYLKQRIGNSGYYMITATH